MPNSLLFTNACVILPDRFLPNAHVEVHDGRVRAVGAGYPFGTQNIDLQGDYLAPGFIDLHVHGGAGHDFMDGTEEAFRVVCTAHLRHGTTSLTPTTTVARHDQHLTFLECCRRFKNRDSRGARVPGAHFYGPYFALEARGCHPGDTVRAPVEEEFRQYLEFAECINRATVAPELPGAETFVRACRERSIGCNAGHSHATFEQMEAALSWGVTHVDHLFCAMSDRARLRQSQTYPMRGGVMEATLFFDALTTEVIADGKHLTRELLLLAYKIKGPDRLALVTDCNRALDMPDGEYLFGPKDGGEPIVKRDGVGIMPDGESLASSVVGMDHCVRTFHQLTGVPLPEVVRMASLTPARIAGVDKDLGSIETGKCADFVVLDRELRVRAVYLAGQLVHTA
ncbi:MAG: N-acetylglucosamine-6-phosphate deacetylase [Gemmataceae bacterium]|nr:N-acetylglucosamine-6-phosphate deacetylase [Gemmataceae bacterium]MCI0739908.1 N-acetylglucosamine-6-phosphate deacetylase [Gemmataceae bacterium]